ncbi:GAF domain-containing protein [Streptomyces sp. NPDC093064]|uniref:GAF domain-containing protein n=1 Tax=Streptomyces sp. NPDC093064 TaxID=3366020 RepID=UPI0037F2E7E3
MRPLPTRADTHSPHWTSKIPQLAHESAAAPGFGEEVGGRCVRGASAAAPGPVGPDGGTGPRRTDRRSSPEEFIRENPHMLGVPEASGKQAWAFMPMVTSGRSVGVFVVSYAQPHTFTTEERALYTALSGLGAQALERGRLYDIEHRRARQLQRGLLPRDLLARPVSTSGTSSPGGAWRSK